MVANDHRYWNVQEQREQRPLKPEDFTLCTDLKVKGNNIVQFKWSSTAFCSVCVFVLLHIWFCFHWSRGMKLSPGFPWWLRTYIAKISPNQNVRKQTSDQVKKWTRTDTYKNEYVRFSLEPLFYPCPAVVCMLLLIIQSHVNMHVTKRTENYVTNHNKDPKGLADGDLFTRPFGAWSLINCLESNPSYIFNRTMHKLWIPCQHFPSGEDNNSLMVIFESVLEDPCCFCYVTLVTRLFFKHLVRCFWKSSSPLAFPLELSECSSQLRFWMICGVSRSFWKPLTWIWLHSFSMSLARETQEKNQNNVNFRAQL